MAMPRVQGSQQRDVGATAPPAETPPQIIRGLDPFAVRQGAKLSVEFIDQLCAQIATGHGMHVSAVALGISRRTFDRWIARGREELAALEQTAQEAETDPDFSDLTLYGYLCRKLEQTQAATIGDAEGRVYRDKPELYLRLSSAGRAAGWGNKIDVDVIGQIDHQHTHTVASPLTRLDDNQLAAVLDILVEIGALEAATQSRDPHPVVEADAEPAAYEEPELPSPLPEVSTQPTAPVLPPAEMAPMPKPLPQVAEDPFSERDGARYHPNHSVFEADARPVRSQRPGDSARWTMGQRARSLSDLVRHSDW